MDIAHQLPSGFTVKKLLPLLGLPLFVLAGCGNQGGGQTAGSGASSNTAAGAASKSVKVALLTPGDINDQGWNQLAYEGLEKLEKDGYGIAHQVTKAASDHQPAMQDFADQGYKVVLLHGYEYGNAAKAVAPQFPDTRFVVIAGNVKQAPNLATVVPKLEDATYLLGMAAGFMTKTGKVGLIGGMNIPVIGSTFDAFKLGVKAANPSATVLPAKFVGDFEDQVKGKEYAKALIAAGADVLFHNADQAGKGMFAAAQESAEAGKPIYVMGSNRNQNSLAPAITLASGVIEMPEAFESIVKSVEENTFKPDFIELNLKNGLVAVEWNEALKSKVPAPALQKIEASAKQIKEGKLKIQRKV